jgi:hypothetical protein
MFSAVLGASLLGATFIILSYLKMKVNTFDKKIFCSFFYGDNGLKRLSKYSHHLNIKASKMKEKRKG